MPFFGITMVCGHRAFGKQVSVFEVGKHFRGGKLTKMVSVFVVGKCFGAGKRFGGW